MSITLALQYVRILEAANTNTFLLLAIGSELRALEEGVRPEAEAMARVRALSELSLSLMSQNRRRPIGPP
jgi:hypothetical protein